MVNTIKKNTKERKADNRILKWNKEPRWIILLRHISWQNIKHINRHVGGGSHSLCVNNFLTSSAKDYDDDEDEDDDDDDVVGCLVHHKSSLSDACYGTLLLLRKQETRQRKLFHFYIFFHSLTCSTELCCAIIWWAWIWHNLSHSKQFESFMAYNLITLNHKSPFLSSHPLPASSLASSSA
jgi:hypothetical protein